jgi:hypothetical protein
LRLLKSGSVLPRHVWIAWETNICVWFCFPLSPPFLLQLPLPLRLLLSFPLSRFVVSLAILGVIAHGLTRLSGSS